MDEAHDPAYILLPRHRIRSAPMDVHLASCVPMKISSQSLQDREHQPLRCARFEKPKLQTKHTHSAPTPRPHATLVTIAFQANVSCNLGRDVTSSRCASLVDGRSSSIPSASTLCVSGCRVGHDRPLLFIDVLPNLRAVPRHERSSTYRLCLPANVEYHADHVLVRSAHHAHVGNSTCH